MASAAVPGEDLDCAVCHETFQKPRILRCGHLLCRGCLVSWLQSQPGAECPLCRHVIVSTEDRATGKSWEDMADSFPADLYMETLVECHQLLNEDHECRVCVTQKATSMCTTCRDFFCTSCATIHNKMSMLQHHTVEKLSSLTPEKLASTRPSFCSAHGNEVSQVFCSTHETLICLLCASTDHRQCTNMTQLETKVEEARAALADMRAKLGNTKADLQHAVHQLDHHLQDVKEKFKVSTAEIKALRKRLDTCVNKLEERLNDDLRKACDDAEAAANEAKTCLLQSQGRVTVHDGLIQRTERSAYEVAQGMADSLKPQINSLSDSCVLPAGAKVVSSFTLKIDQEAVARVERELSQLGQLKVFPADLLAQPPKPAALTFHDQKKSEYVVLSNNQQTAEKTGGWYCYGIVLSCEPMEVNCLYQVRVDQTCSGFSSSDIFLGVVTQSPDTVTLPSTSEDLTSAVVVHPSCLLVNGKRVDSQVGSSLPEVREGGCVGLMLDRSRTLHLYRDGQPLGVIAPDLPHPCHFMVDLMASWTKVTTLPVQHMK